MTDDVWRISRKVAGTQMCLASSKVDGYVHFCYSSGERSFDFGLQEARMLHRALGAMLPDMVDMPEIPSAKPAVAANEVTVSNEAAPKKGAAAPEIAKTQHGGTRWTDEEDAKLVALLKAGKSIDEMSKEHSRSPSAIMSRLHKNDLIEVRVK